MAPNDSYSVEETIREVSQINFSGNLLPNSWFDKILLDNGKLDVNGLLILSEIVYWYRPRTVRNELTGEVKGHEKKFAADMLQMSVSAFANKFHLTVRQVRDAINRLEKNGFIIKVRKTFKISSFNCPNVLFLAPVVSKLKSMEKELPIVERPVNEDELLNNIEYVDHRTSDVKTSLVKETENAQKPHEIKGSDFTDVADSDASDDITEQEATAYVNPCDDRVLHERRYNVTPPTTKRHSYIKNTKTTTENTQRLAAAKKGTSSHTGVPPQATQRSFAAAPILKNEEDILITDQLTENQSVVVQKTIQSLCERGGLELKNQQHWQKHLTKCLLSKTCYSGAGNHFLKKLNTLKKAITSGQLKLDVEVKDMPLSEFERNLKDEISRLKLERHSQESAIKKMSEYGSNSMVNIFKQKISELSEQISLLEQKYTEGALS